MTVKTHRRRRQAPLTIHQTAFLLVSLLVAALVFAPASLAGSKPKPSPTVAIVGGPGETTTDNTPTFAFTGVAGATFQCSVDGSAYANCTSPYTTAPLAYGSHTFCVRAASTSRKTTNPPACATFQVITDTFRPAFSQTFTSLAANDLADTRIEYSVQPGNVGTKALKIQLPSFMGANFTSFGDPVLDRCPGSMTAACPPQARIGTATVTSPLMPTPMELGVYYIHKSPLPWLGLSANATSSTPTFEMVGNTSAVQADPTCDPNVTLFCPTTYQIHFQNIANYPLGSLTLNLGGPDRVTADGRTLSGKFLSMAQAEDLACEPGKTSVAATPHDGTLTVTLTKPFAPTGCV